MGQRRPKRSVGRGTHPLRRPASALCLPVGLARLRGRASPRRRFRPCVRPIEHDAADGSPGVALRSEFRRSDELARLEAVLFLAREPLNTRRIAKLAKLPDGTRARVLLRELNRLYDASGSAFRAEPLAGGFQLLSRTPLGPWLRRLLDAQPQNRLSAAAMETLAIVAYRQPVSRAEIEAIRGVGCEEMLRQLLDRDLVAIGGRAEEIGRPNLYVTTRYFLRAFGLGRIEELPPVEQQRPGENAS